jgi:hypothetical protein
VAPPAVLVQSSQPWSIPPVGPETLEPWNAPGFETVRSRRSSLIVVMPAADLSHLVETSQLRPMHRPSPRRVYLGRQQKRRIKEMAVPATSPQDHRVGASLLSASSGCSEADARLARCCTMANTEGRIMNTARVDAASPPMIAYAHVGAHLDRRVSALRGPPPGDSALGSARTAGHTAYQSLRRRAAVEPHAAYLIRALLLRNH